MSGTFEGNGSHIMETCPIEYDGRRPWGNSSIIVIIVARVSKGQVQRKVLSLVEVQSAEDPVDERPLRGRKTWTAGQGK